VLVSLLAFSFGLSESNMRIIGERGLSPEASNGAQRKERSQSRYPGQPLQFRVHRPNLTDLLGVFQQTENGCCPQAWPGAYVIDALMLNELLTQTPIAIYHAPSRLPECIFLSIVSDDDALVGLIAQLSKRLCNKHLLSRGGHGHTRAASSAHALPNWSASRVLCRRRL
jgi:hypothetical protein